MQHFRDEGAELSDSNLRRDHGFTCVQDALFIHGVPLTIRVTELGRHRGKKDARARNGTCEWEFTAPMCSIADESLIHYGHRLPGK